MRDELNEARAEVQRLRGLVRDIRLSLAVTVGASENDDRKLDEARAAAQEALKRPRAGEQR